jgi:hypothetical protein
MGNTRWNTTGRRVRKISAGLVAVTLLVASTGCASIRPQMDVAHIGYMASAAADISTTNKALASGATEMNPLLGSNPTTGRMAAVKTAGFFALRRIETSWERKLRRPLKWYEKALLWGLPIAVQSLAAVHNSNVARR